MSQTSSSGIILLSQVCSHPHENLTDRKLISRNEVIALIAFDDRVQNFAELLFIRTVKNSGESG